MNRDQLEKAIRGVYGSETDAATYIGKFLHLSLRLPKDTSRDVIKRQSPNQRFLRQKLGEHGIENDE
ncbi:P-loop NTPase fold protein, partial [Bacillus amyloliquefaciens]|uniref:P-loop NTPase fold protein n=1 Tax=Bacillus amyloliquefaciens TaxID=1390 RepID=UPI0034D707C2